MRKIKHSEEPSGLQKIENETMIELKASEPVLKWHKKAHKEVKESYRK